MVRISTGSKTVTESGDATSGAEMDRIPPGAELPVRSTTKPSGQLGCAVVLFLASLIICGYGVYRAVLLRGTVGWATVAVFGAALAVALIGWAVKVYEESYEFTARDVTRRWRTLVGRKEWTEPYSNYQGVLMKEQYHSGGKNHASYTEYIAVLKHVSETNKDVQLYVSRRHEGFRKQAERYCRSFGLPALRTREDGTLEERSVEDLDKSVRDMVAEGRMEVTFDPSQPPPGDVLNLRIEGTGLRISAMGNSFGKFRRVVALITLVSGLALVAAGLFIRAIPTPARIMFVLFGVVDIAVGQGLAFVARRIGQELYVSPSEVASWWVLPWGEVARRTVSAAQVEEVSVRTPPDSQGFTAVVAETDDQHVMFGMGLTEDEKGWVRDAVIAVISKDAPGQMSSGSGGSPPEPVEEPVEE